MNEDRIVDTETGEIKEEKRIQLTGTCVYCRQTMIISWPIGMAQTQELIDHAATERCTCRDAQTQKNICARERAAKIIIERKFGTGSDEDSEPLDRGTIDLLTSIAFSIAQEKIIKATFNLGNGIKCNMSLSNSGKIKIKRTKTKEETDEV